MSVLKLINRCCRLGGNLPQSMRLPVPAIWQNNTLTHRINLIGTSTATTTTTMIRTATTTSTAATTSNSTRTPEKRDNSNNNNTEWQTVYRLPLVRWASAFNRLKIYQGSFTILGLPLAIAFEQAGQIPAHTTAIFGAVGGTTVVTLALFSLVLRNLIGFIYVNSEGNRLKFAYVDFWGRRRETVAAIDDIRPLWEDNKSARLDFYKNVRFNSDAKRSYKLLNNYGIIVEPDIYADIFSN